MKKNITPYKHYLVEKAKILRKNATYSERLMWKYLRNKRFMGYDFDQQKPIDNYIVDFFCKKLMLAIEIDGITHSDKAENDMMRQNKIEELGITVLRFNALDVVNNTIGVLETIQNWIEGYHNTLPSIPSQEGRLKV